jgi:hypothetical protein
MLMIPLIRVRTARTVTAVGLSGPVEEDAGATETIAATGELVGASGRLGPTGAVGRIDFLAGMVYLLAGFVSQLDLRDTLP